MANGPILKKERILDLEREVHQLLQRQREIVLETADIEEFLGGQKLIDGVETMQILRDLANQNDWFLFVFDYGALVRINANGAPSSGERISAHSAPRRHSLGPTNAAGQ